LFNNYEGMDLFVYHYGLEKCSPGHSYGPALRDHFLLHYVLSGSGTFEVDGHVYTLHENQGFLNKTNYNQDENSHQSDHNISLCQWQPIHKRTLAVEAKCPTIHGHTEGIYSINSRGQ